jgi:hypothetical protein
MSEKINLSTQVPPPTEYSSSSWEQKQEPTSSVSTSSIAHKLEAEQEVIHKEIERKQVELLQSQIRAEKEIEAAETKRRLEEQARQTRKIHEHQEFQHAQEVQHAAAELRTPTTKLQQGENLSAMQGINRPAELRRAAGGAELERVAEEQDEETKQAEETAVLPSHPGEGTYEFREQDIVQDDLAKLKLREQEQEQQQQTSQQTTTPGLLSNQPAYGSEEEYEEEEETEGTSNREPGTFQKLKTKLKAAGHDIKKSVVSSFDAMKHSSVGSKLHDVGHQNKMEIKKQADELRHEPYETRAYQKMASSSSSSSQQQQQQQQPTTFSEPKSYETTTTMAQENPPNPQQIRAQTLVGSASDLCPICQAMNCQIHGQAGGIQQHGKLDFPPPEIPNESATEFKSDF